MYLIWFRIFLGCLLQQRVVNQRFNKLFCKKDWMKFIRNREIVFWHVNMVVKIVCYSFESNLAFTVRQITPECFLFFISFIKNVII